VSRLDGRRVVVAGVGGGLGPAVVAALAAAGAEVIGTDRDAERLAALDLARADVVDLLDAEATHAWADELGDVDALLHLVGGWKGGTPIGEADLADWDLLHDLLIRTVQHTSRAFLPALRRSAHGRFALVSAKQAQQPTSGNAAYAASKAAAEAWTLALADELKETQATANIVVVNAIGDAKPSFTPPEQIAETLVWLCSDAAAKMNGKRVALHP
jgi:NAD(P)-dependent dehydrogenase (short-subunit alcohol dehydrogenase family)